MGVVALGAAMVDTLFRGIGGPASLPEPVGALLPFAVLHAVAVSAELRGLPHIKKLFSRACEAVSIRDEVAVEAALVAPVFYDDLPVVKFGPDRLGSGA